MTQVPRVSGCMFPPRALRVPTQCVPGPHLVCPRSAPRASPVLAPCVPGPHFLGRPATLFGHQHILPSPVPSQCVPSPLPERFRSQPPASPVLTSCVPGPHFFGRPATLFGHQCILPSPVPRKSEDLQRSLDDSTAQHFLAVVPDGKLTGGNTPLGLIEKNVQATFPHQEGSAL